MSGIQSKVMDAISAFVSRSGFELVIQPSYQNRGTAYIMSGLETFMSFVYDFQTGSASIQFYPKGKEPKMTVGFTDPTCVLDAYLKYHDLAPSMQKIESLIGSIAKS